MRNPVAVLVIILLIMVALDTRFTFQSVISASTTITVPDDYPTIQEAINNASDGSTIFVRAGTYPEHLTINKPLALIGEDRNTTIIDAEGKIGLIVSITSDYTSIEGFTFQGAGGPSYGYDAVLNFSSSSNIVKDNIITNNELCGITLDSSHNNSIVNNDITNNFNGILLKNSTDNIISGNTIVGDSQTGILLYGSNNNMVVGNNVSYGGSGITLMDYEWYDFHRSSSNNSLIDNTLTGNTQGISIYASPYNIMRNNTLNENSYSLEVSWYMYADNKISYFIQDIDESNTIDGRPVLYLVNHHNEQIESNAAYVAVVNCTNLTIKNLQVHDNSEGIVIAGTANSTFQYLNVTHNRYGIYLFESDNNTVYNCNVVGGQVGIALESSWHNHIDHNNVTNTYGEGIILTYSNWNNITYNKLSNNKYRGVLVGLSLENTIAYNTVEDNRMAGIGISSDGKGTPEHNLVHGNNIINNTCGIQLGDTSSNLIYGNNFINNKQQASSSVSYGNMGDGNVWDNGYSTGGNYWSDYNGTDANYDGIGDTPYAIDANHTDNYPLMGMFYGSVMMWQEKMYNVDVISNSTISRMGYVVRTLSQWPNGTIIEEWFESIYFYVSGEDRTYGFCRVYIPVNLLDATYRVFVNGTEVSCNLLPCSNSTHSYLYFNYSHSKQEVTIIPELPSFQILPLIFTATLLAAIIYRRKRR